VEARESVRALWGTKFRTCKNGFLSSTRHGEPCASVSPITFTERVLSDKPVDEKSARVDRRLWDKPVRRGNTKAHEKGCQAEQRELIVEASRHAEWELGALNNQRLRATSHTTISIEHKETL
jgi:hypothetical protein